MKKLTIYLLLSISIVLLSGCHKRHSGKHPAADSDTTAVAVDTTTAQPQTTEPQQPPVVVWTPQYQSAILRGQCEISYGKHHLSTAATGYYLADSIIILSAQPLLGIEAARAEATADGVIVVDKINRQYASCTYPQLSSMAGQKITFRILEQMLEEQAIGMPIGSPITLSYEGITAQLTMQQVRTNTDVNATRLRLNNYTRTTLNKIIGGK